MKIERDRCDRDKAISLYLYSLRFIMQNSIAHNLIKKLQPISIYQFLICFNF